MKESILAGINAPCDVLALTDEELTQLAAEIRETLIATVSQTGGHLASNLGVVELTIAMHRCFDSPRDKFVWDVGHQVYTHKLLTGRQDAFSTLRKEGGLSGFSKPPESEHDIFYAGHAGVSVSGALGLSCANAISGKGNYTVAVVGDGSFTNGMVYEALNNIGVTHNNLIIVLNENEMSISQNVGSVAKYLAAIRAKPEYTLFKARTERALTRIPFVGKNLATNVLKVKTSVKNMLYQSTWFEDLGLRYIGPIDGHNIVQLCEAFESAKLLKRPAIIHINTVKGKGYDLAEQQPQQFHGVSRFDVVSGETVPCAETYSARFGKKMCELAQRNMNVCAITAAMSIGTGLEEFSVRYPGRFFDVGIAEEHAVTFAGGLARGGMVPVFAVYATFLQRCYDQLLHDGSLQNQKMVIAVDRAGFVEGDGETHQGLYDVALLNGIPHVQIQAPANFAQLETMLEAAVYGENVVHVIRYPRGCEENLPAGKDADGASWSLFGESGAAVALVTYGRITAQAEQARQQLFEQGISAKLIQLKRIIPLAPEAVGAAAACAHIFFFEEGVRSGGIGESFAAQLLAAGFRGSYHLTAVPDCFVPQMCTASALAKYGLDAPGMVRAVQGALSDGG